MGKVNILKSYETADGRTWGSPVAAQAWSAFLDLDGGTTEHPTAPDTLCSLVTEMRMRLLAALQLLQELHSDKVASFDDDEELV